MNKVEQQFSDTISNIQSQMKEVSQSTLKNAAEKFLAQPICNGGPAFPRPCGMASDTEANSPQSGMSLRDYFAAQVLPGIIASTMGVLECRGWTLEGNVTAAYEYADAMLLERSKST